MFTNFAVVASVYYAMKGWWVIVLISLLVIFNHVIIVDFHRLCDFIVGNRSYAMFGIAMATYLSLYPITMVALIILLLNQNMPGKVGEL